MKTGEIIEKYIVENGCFERAKNQRIYNKFFKHGSRYVFKTAWKKYDLASKTLCDIGCAYGVNLLNTKEGSYGIDINTNFVNFANSIGLNVIKRNIVSDDISDLKRVDVLWQSAILEHIDSPHIFLRKCWNMIDDGGIMIMYVPIMPMFKWMRFLPILGKFFASYKHEDHVNFFTKETVKFQCERAGFETIENNPWYPGFLRIFDYFNFISSTVYVGRKNSNWEYPSNCERLKADNKDGYIYKRYF
ncbi:TPA: hypothetical protein DGT35_00295 [Patescibacteria group bacterium]|nr:hypothetical protein [Patescibacteria group bacterium]|tara:strand:- start:2514 stop:3251 length:738 start_codon:yes stop_codon:yes gene_type:complete